MCQNTIELYLDITFNFYNYINAFFFSIHKFMIKNKLFFKYFRSTFIENKKLMQINVKYLEF